MSDPNATIQPPALLRPLLFAVVFVILSTAVASLELWTKSSQRRAQARVLAADLWNQFSYDRRSAEAVYVGKRVEVIGDIQSTSRFGESFTVLMLKSPNAYLPLHATMADGDSAPAATIQPGDTVLLTCECKGILLGAPALGDCRLVDVVARSSPPVSTRSIVDTMSAVAPEVATCKQASGANFAVAHVSVDADGNVHNVSVKTLGGHEETPVAVCISEILRREIHFSSSTIRSSDFEYPYALH